LQRIHALTEDNLVVQARHNRDIVRVSKRDVELGQQAGLGSVRVRRHILTALLLYELKNRELLRLAKNWLRFGSLKLG